MAHWIVHERRAPDSGNWELSVLDEHSEEVNYLKGSSGGECEAKILVWSSGGPCHYKVTDQSLAEKLRQVARDYAAELNAKSPR